MRVLDRCVPPSALRWGRLTREDFDWWGRMVTYHGEHTSPHEAPAGFQTNRIAIRMEPGYQAPFIDWTSAMPQQRANRDDIRAAMFAAMADWDSGQ